MQEQELSALVALCAAKKAELKLTNVVIADMCRFSISSVDRFFRCDMKRPTWEFIRALAQILDIPTQEIRAVAPNMREGFRGDPMPPQDRDHVASSQDLNDLVDVYRSLVQQKEETFTDALHSVEDDFADALSSLKSQHKIAIDELNTKHSDEIKRLTRITRNLFTACCVLVLALFVVLCIFR